MCGTEWWKMNVRLSEIARAVGGVVTGPDREVHGIVTDNREIKNGYTLFCAIRGARVDGHDYVAKVLEDATCSALVDDVRFSYPGTVLVDDVVSAIARIGEYWRRVHISDVCLVGVTGSVGKTTAKEMIRSALSSRRVYCSFGNRNSRISAPLALTEVPDGTEFMVSELGMSEKGEMETLSRVVRPDICVITNIGSAHIEQLGSKEAILREKLSIAAHMRDGGKLVLNYDDELLRRECARENCVTYGFSGGAALHPETFEENTDGSVFTLAGDPLHIEFRVRVPGRHNVLNALAAIAVADLLGISRKDAAQGLELFRPGGMRQHVYMTSGIRVIADCYNASPESMDAALSVLCSYNGRRIAVLGDMLELGSFSEAAHRKVGESARAKGVDELLCLGKYSQSLCEGYGGGTSFAQDDRNAMISYIKRLVRKGDTVLFKASNAMRFHEIIAESGLAHKDE